MRDESDVVIVGAGSAGCVLAARLSADPGVRVLLLEAGPDYVGSDLPPALLDSRRGPSIAPATDWSLQGLSGLGGQILALPRGRVVGGSSAVNATFALRGSPADYDAWAAAGVEGWAFTDLLPAFQRLETDLDFGAAEYHGDSGPIPIGRYVGLEQSALAAAGTTALAAAGLATIDDHNAPGAVGVAPLPVNTVGGRRISTASAYLDPVRHRPNLRVRGGAVVRRVLATAGAVTGVELMGGHIVAAPEVYLCAGAYLSPVVLLRSGIGPADDLRALGIDVTANLKGVGANLHDHPATSVDLPYSGPLVGDPVFQLVGTTHSSAAHPHRDPPDLQLIVAGPYAGVEDGIASCFVGAALLKPHSRGRVRLRSADPDVPPEIDLGYFTTATDLPRLLEGLAIAEDVVSHTAMRTLTAGQRVSPESLNGKALKRYVVGNVWTYHHPVGTCAMGPDPEQGAVVDAGGRVYGVDGLSVVDAAILPEIPSANTNLPTIAAAEHIASRRLEPVATAVVLNQNRSSRSTLP
ncbi:MAG TPA: GMC oxidoreductase [Propionibacteriaceae bacterium]|nr:GMC oxidoreductase [Propionibacteriaceae bacterium]